MSNVAGGRGNTASCYYSTVAGGAYNTASNFYSNVANGRQNTASGKYSNVSGGCANTASGYASNVGGGTDNVASGQYSSVVGGYNNCIRSTATCSSIIAGTNITAISANAAYAPTLVLTNVPTGCNGLGAGSIWSNSGVLTIV